MVLLFLEHVLLIDQVDDKRHDLEVLVVLFDGILVVQGHLHLALPINLQPKLLFLPVCLGALQ